MTKEFTDANFKEEAVEASKQKPVLVDFFAPWCGPCKMQGPIINELAEEIGDKAVIGKLNTEDSQQTASDLGVMSIPTLIVFKDGEAKEILIGLQTKENLLDLIKKYSV